MPFSLEDNTRWVVYKAEKNQTIVFKAPLVNEIYIKLNE